MLLSTCWLGATQTHTGRQLARGGGDRRRIAANIRLGRGARCRCGAAKACGCRHERKSLTAGAVETLLEQKATLAPAASVTDGTGGLVRLKGLTVDVTARKRAADHQRAC